PPLSALTTLISQTSSDPVSALTTQVLHNLQHQHLWTSLQTNQIHNPATERTSGISGVHDDHELATLPTSTLISGIPPHRVYTHPDEQLYLLELGLREEDIPAERMFVLSSTQGQSWTLRKLAAVFDSLPAVEPSPNNSSPLNKSSDDKERTEEEEKKAAKLAKYFERKEQAGKSKEWGGKRLLFAMVDRLVGGDGTVVYYIFQEGHVKPRQN
ncbi:hypothetical protein BGW36DRAFT_256837, partial [Talaromyces proteolyticus]